MDTLEILNEIIGLERAVGTLYLDKAATIDNIETKRIFKILAAESQAHAKQLESCYGVVSEAKPAKILTKELLTLLDAKIGVLEGKFYPVEIVQGGMEIEKYVEEVYDTIADVLESKEKAGEIVGEVGEQGLTASQVVRGIAREETKHVEILKALAVQITPRHPS